LARRFGWPENIVANVATFETLDLDDQTRWALRFADRMTRDPHSVDDEFFTQLRTHFTDGDIVELAVVIGIFNYFNRFNDALRIDPTPAGER
jgi:alkylhydroperoxidase family enzyme